MAFTHSLRFSNMDPFKSCPYIFTFFIVVTLSRKTIFDGHLEDPDYTPLPEDRPGGFEWGNRNNGEGEQEAPPQQ